jgi:antitoxin MazE
MRLNIARWGNSLALCIPADYARRIGLKEGGSVETGLTADGDIAIRPLQWNRKAFSRELAMMRDAMPNGTSVMDELRRAALY